ncbi:MAG: hypothetical protein PHD76_11880 [Methylacidiphilales bacterium]|nr:hypothetical protein [Candidatus Methylacidiphilales bacterium]
MKKNRHRKKQHSSSERRSVAVSWFEAKKPVLQYAGIFAGLVLLFALLSLTPAYQSHMVREVEWNVKLARGMLSLFGGGASVVTGATFSRETEAILEVKPECFSLYYCWLFCPAVLAFPAPLLWRFAGALLGSVILLTMNVLRVGSLFWVGSYYPGYFTAAHDQFWPLLSLFVIAALMGGWLLALQDPASQQTVLTYEGLGRVKTLVDGVGTINWTYDAEGNPTDVTQSSANIHRTFDDLSRLHTCTDTSGIERGLTEL